MKSKVCILRKDGEFHRLFSFVSLLINPICLNNKPYFPGLFF